MSQRVAAEDVNMKIFIYVNNKDKYNRTFHVLFVF